MAQVEDSRAREWHGKGRLEHGSSMGEGMEKQGIEGIYVDETDIGGGGGRG